MVTLTNREHEIVALSAIELGTARHMTLEKIAEYSTNSTDAIGTLTRKRKPNGILHFFKCCIAAGIVDSVDLPLNIRWPSLKQKPCYRIPQLWYTEAYGGSQKTIPHGHLTDYIGRTLPQYLTTQTFDVYMSALDDHHKRFIATILLTSSRNFYPLDEAMRVINVYIQEAFPYYKKLPKKLHKIFVDTLFNNSIKRVPDTVELANRTTLSTIGISRKRKRAGEQ